MYSVSIWISRIDAQSNFSITEFLSFILFENAEKSELILMKELEYKFQFIIRKNRMCD
jgi:hypothetical protein